MIGLFDSGIGGLTVVRELLRHAPTASFVYLGDTARTPYGNKSADTVTRYSIENAKFLLDRGATSIVIACNSASAVATEALRKEYPNVPIFEVIAPAVEDALAVTKGRIGVIGTRATILSGAYERRLKERRGIDVTSIPCPMFVPLVEEGWLEDAETKRIGRRYLSPLRQAGVDTLILGCTHYPLLTPIIQRYMGGRVNLIDSGASVVKRLGDLLSDRHERGHQSFYLTDVSRRSEEIAASWLGRPITFEPVTLG
ncbi:MAG: glutamate racemase [Patescibacteria group bacterium]|jgi:glutamate racemase